MIVAPRGRQAFKEVVKDDPNKGDVSKLGEKHRLEQC